ncbi:hypothetical protein OG871_40250 (plasmid) [Kitasatospora sp. NBC_00374]|uniref:hypothetical protein n=1 Tax=Kitasatospora sp. NBC_00374 TaxID=2975964 RepID=UPI002F91B858
MQNPGAPAQRSAPSQPGGAGDRLPATVRERRPAMAVLAALLILAGGLGGTALVQQAAEKVDAVKVTQRIAPGQAIPASAIQQVQVAKDTDVPFVRWDQRGALTSKYFAASEIPVGTLLTGPMLTTKVSVSSDQAVVGLSLKQGQFPPGLREGDKIRVLWVGKDLAKAPVPGATGTGQGAASANGLSLSEAAVVRQVFKADTAAPSANLSLSITVAADKSGPIAQAASAGEVALVLLPADPK